MYQFIQQPDKHRLVFNHDGTFDYDPREAMQVFKRAVDGVLCANGTFDLLVDCSLVRSFPVDHMTVGEHVFKWSCDNGLRRCAVVMVDAAGRLAVSRATRDDRRIDFVLSIAEAERWLDRDRRGPDMPNSLAS